MTAFLNRAWPLLLLLVTACGGPGRSELTMEARKAYRAGDLGRARVLLDEALAADAKEAAITHLERGTLLLRAGEHADSYSDLRKADDAIEVLDYGDDASVEFEALTRRAEAAYRGQPHEKTLINGFNVLNTLATGDLESTRIEARRAETMKGAYDYDCPLTDVLYGVAFHASGREEDAYAAYKNTWEKLKAPWVLPFLVHCAETASGGDLAHWQGLVSRHTPTGAPFAGRGDLTGWGLVVVLNGQAPVRVPAMNASRTLKYAKIQAQSNRFDSGHVHTAGTTVPLTLTVDVETESLRAFEVVQEQVLAGRRIQQMSARAMGGSGMANLYDDRCWSLLPADIQVALVPTNGATEARVRMTGAGGASREVSAPWRNAASGLQLAIVCVPE